MENWRNLKTKVKTLVTRTETNDDLRRAPQTQQPPIPSYNRQPPPRLPPSRTNHFPPPQRQHQNTAIKPLPPLPTQLTQQEIDVHIRQQNKEKEHQSWLDSEKHWKVRVGPNWIPKKVLGQGSEGIVGWWQYSLSSSGDPSFFGLKNIAVKQNVMNYLASNQRGLRPEARFYKLLERAKSEHVPKIYGELCQDMGQGTMDGDWGDVERIFLEFCPGGDLQALMDRRIDRDEPFSETEIWEIFHCLARAAHLLRYQSVDRDEPQVNSAGREIVHLDIKPGNVLIGHNITDGEHHHTPPYKLADFGFAKIVPDVQTDQFWRDSWGGTPQGLPPEQVQDPYAMNWLNNKGGGVRPWVVPDPDSPRQLKNTYPLGKERRYGSETNIWAIGLMLWCMMRGYKDPPWDGYVAGERLELIRWGNPNSSLCGKGPSVGTLVDRQGDAHYKQVPYSEALWRCIFECLLYIPRMRPLVEDLVRRTREGMETARAFEGGGGSAPDYTPFAEPQISDRWNPGGGGGGRGPPLSRQVTAMRNGMNAAQAVETARRKKEREHQLIQQAERGIARLDFGNQPGNRGMPACLIPGPSNRQESADEKRRRLRDEGARGIGQPNTKQENGQDGLMHHFQLKEQERLDQQAKNAEIDQNVYARRYKAAVEYNQLKGGLVTASATGDNETGISCWTRIEAFERDEETRIAAEEDEKARRDHKAELAVRNIQRDRQVAQATQSQNKRKSDNISRDDLGHNDTRGGFAQGADDTQYGDPKRRKDTQKDHNSQPGFPNQEIQYAEITRRLLTDFRNPPMDRDASRDRNHTSRMERDRSKSNAEEAIQRRAIDLAAAINAFDDFDTVEMQSKRPGMVSNEIGRAPIQPRSNHQFRSPPNIIPGLLPNIRVRVSEGSTSMVAERVYIMHLTMIRTDMSVLDVKKRIEQKARYYSIKANSMRLFVNGKELVNSKYLGDVGNVAGKEWVCSKA